MAKCVQCGSILIKGAKFCADCGVKVPEIIQDNFCNECGEKLQANDVFCMNCGTKVVAKGKQSTPMATKGKSAGKQSVRKSTKRKKEHVNDHDKKGWPLWVKMLIGGFLIMLALDSIPWNLIDSDNDYGYDTSSYDQERRNDEGVRDYPDSPQDNADVDFEADTDADVDANIIPEVDLKERVPFIIKETKDRFTKRVESSGGTVAYQDVKLIIPPRAVEDRRAIFIQPVVENIPAGDNKEKNSTEAFPVGQAFDIGPRGLKFDDDVTVEFKYKLEDIPNGLGQRHLFLAYFDGLGWKNTAAKHNVRDQSFAFQTKEFPGSLLYILGAIIIPTGLGYIYVTDRHKKVKEMVWDPVTKNWMHKFVEPKNKSVIKIADRLRLGAENSVDLDEIDRLLPVLDKLDKNKIPVAFGVARNDAPRGFHSLAGRYISDLNHIRKIDEYIGDVDKTSKLGDCIEYTNLFVSMLRHKGMQAKGVSGYRLGLPHAWTEVVLGDNVYVISEEGKLHNREEYVSGEITLAPEGDSYRKMWDEKGVTPYKKDWYTPVLIIEPPRVKIYAGDDLKYTFTARTLGVPKGALFSWSFNRVGYAVKGRNKTNTRSFAATGKFTLQCKAEWSGKKIEGIKSFEVLGSNDRTTDRLIIRGVTLNKGSGPFSEPTVAGRRPVSCVLNGKTYHTNSDDDGRYELILPCEGKKVVIKGMEQSLVREFDHCTKVITQNLGGIVITQVSTKDPDDLPPPPEDPEMDKKLREEMIKWGDEQRKKKKK